MKRKERIPLEIVRKGLEDLLVETRATIKRTFPREEQQEILDIWAGIPERLGLVPIPEEDEGDSEG